jgi:hypothetical protein
MRVLFPAVLLCSSLLSGCSYFGYYKHVKAERAPSEVGDKIRFPSSYEAGVELDGPTLAALAVAMNDFKPPGAKANYYDEQVANCLSRWDTYDTSVLKASEDLFFINFMPDLSRCGVDTSIHILLDIGASYAIDGKGRILESY